MRTAFVAALSLLLLLAIPVSALATFTRTTAPALKVTTATLAAPRNVTVPGTSTGSVAVSWTAPTGAPAATRYYVTRKIGTTSSAACSTSLTVTLATTSCTDAVPASGSYTYTVTAIIYSWTATSSASSTVVVSMAQLNFTQNPQSNKSGLTLGNVIVQLLSSTGSVVTTAGVPITITLSDNTTSGTLAGTRTVNTVSGGTATFNTLSVNKVGSYTLTATATNYASDTSTSFTITAGEAANLTVVSGSGQSAHRSVSFANPLVVLVTDAARNPVSGATVSYTAPSSGASGVFSNNNAALNDSSDSSGLTSLTFKANSTAGSYSVTAVGGGDTVLFSLTNT